MFFLDFLQHQILHLHYFLQIFHIETLSFLWKDVSIISVVLPSFKAPRKYASDSIFSAFFTCSETFNG